MFSRLKNLINKTNDTNNDPQQTSSVMTEEELQRRQRAMADQKRREVEQEYQQEHPDQIREEKELSFENKTNKLKKKLNIAIITVFGLIIIVFLILFFI
ncbi:hypothetical protein [Companilactobacillus sp.]|jgi:hypothetical protein|uniref:hypothetical protein n=1 Tax=Companilactobacillus sp. TaxID=2767905 RepID=UPI0025C0B8EF|nr:hypothetical protein [Companilactobacillus sp.]MCH4008435.1 hypothetical protein [Companilactobacillus sp.]MCH4051386.1 hypothetical protein [Companilactobacillus sp.]MCH4076378.1 hypothetical protein [Companilactobacillus sp.]MCH4124953.1 hypothetical protein [Companilactobacillus sp.]MCH4131495.1 hypothetical protein [Companilactobacillus sp.]